MKLSLPYPPSVNRYYRSVVMGRAVRVLVSKQGREYRAVVGQHKIASGVKDKISGPVDMTVRLVPPDRRKRDIDNPLKALLDALTHSGVWSDDSQVRKLVVWIDPPAKPGRVEVTINPVEENK